ncbi:cystatin-S-like [Arvicanthis niloticus]|uniref:cystatin-S-like n=1 Tax=Arvicanthis niloticus TaxID=61156 RepID=UPI001485D8E5|nr:cystatin-S-like [Arvicanthis niloticus]
MAYLLHSQLFLLATLVLVLNLSYYPVVGNILVGGIEESSMEEYGAREALDFAVSQYNEQNSDMYLSQVVEVKSVKTQVVGGQKYYFEVILGKTTCLKTEADSTHCPLNEQPDQQESEFCSFEVLDVPWENYMALVSSSCHSI